MMANAEENFYRTSHIVLDVLPRYLRHLFLALWNSKYPNSQWDNSPASGQFFLRTEKSQSVKKTVNQNMLHGDSFKFDGTTLFSVLLYSSHNLLHGHPNVRSSIDQLRIIRNTHICRIKGCGGAGCPPPPPIIFERLKLP